MTSDGDAFTRVPKAPVPVIHLWLPPKSVDKWHALVWPQTRDGCGRPYLFPFKQEVSA